VKLIVGRPKDLDLPRGLVRLGIVEPSGLRQHYQQTLFGEHGAIRAGRNLHIVLAEGRSP